MGESNGANGAGDRDRTGMASLEGWGSTIELHPRANLFRLDANLDYRIISTTIEQQDRGVA
ncbi:MAG: hypothetical protein RI895_546 [Actinomycetota bacterium]